jgi:hypothetical protein
MMQLEVHHDGVSRPAPDVRLRTISLGVGVQSVTLILMAERGEIGPRPDCAIFSDTKAEPGYVHEYLRYLRTQTVIPIYEVSAGNLEADLLAGFNSTGQRYASIPAFVRNREGEVGITRRQCTAEYKLEPIIKKTRELLGIRPRQSVRHFLGLKRAEPTPFLAECWIGITTDEIERMARSEHKYVHNRHPLIEARMARRDCERWLAERQYRIPKKSACVFCPFKDNAAWLDLKTNHPPEFARAVRVDQAVRNGNPSKGLETNVMALHRSLKPLEDIDFTKPETDALRFGFANECMGMCGT